MLYIPEKMKWVTLKFRKLIDRTSHSFQLKSDFMNKKTFEQLMSNPPLRYEEI